MLWILQTCWSYFLDSFLQNTLLKILWLFSRSCSILNRKPWSDFLQLLRQNLFSMLPAYTTFATEIQVRLEKKRENSGIHVRTCLQLNLKQNLTIKFIIKILPSKCFIWQNDLQVEQDTETLQSTMQLLLAKCISCFHT